MIFALALILIVFVALILLGAQILFDTIILGIITAVMALILSYPFYRIYNTKAQQYLHAITAATTVLASVAVRNLTLRFLARVQLQEQATFLITQSDIVVTVSVYLVVAGIIVGLQQERSRQREQRRPLLAKNQS